MTGIPVTSTLTTALLDDRVRQAARHERFRLARQAGQQRPVPINRPRSVWSSLLIAVRHQPA